MVEASSLWVECTWGVVLYLAEQLELVNESTLHGRAAKARASWMRAHKVYPVHLSCSANCLCEAPMLCLSCAWAASPFIPLIHFHCTKAEGGREEHYNLLAPQSPRLMQHAAHLRYEVLLKPAARWDGWRGNSCEWGAGIDFASLPCCHSAINDSQLPLTALRSMVTNLDANVSHVSVLLGAARGAGDVFPKTKPCPTDGCDLSRPHHAALSPGVEGVQRQPLRLEK